MATSGFNLAFAKWSFGFSTSVRRRLWLKLATLLRNGAKITEALATIRARRERSHGKNDPTVLAIDIWVRRLNNGDRFSDAIGDWVPVAERMLLAAGERSGKLDANLVACAESMESQAVIRKAVIGGLAYPILLVIASFCVLFFFGFSLIPGFSKAVSADKWTGMAAVTVTLSAWIQAWLWLPALLVTSWAASLFWVLPNWTGPARNRFESYPPFNIYRIVNGSSWIISMASLVNAGVRIEEAIVTTSKYSSKWMRSRSEAILRGLRSGTSLGEAMYRAGNGFPDPEIIDDLLVYSQVSGMDEALKKIANEWVTESVENIKVAMTVVFNVGIVVTGFIIGALVSGLLAMNSQLGQILQQGAR